MQKIYFYHLNILTQQLKVDEYELEKISQGHFGYTLTISKNNYRRIVRRIVRRISEPNNLELERNGINISCYTYHKDKINEFKALAINHVLEYKNKCQKTIEDMLVAIDNCDESLKLLK